MNGDSSAAVNEKGLASDAGELLVLLEGRVRAEVQELQQKRLVSQQVVPGASLREGGR